MSTSKMVKETSQELRMLSSDTLNCQATKIVMNSGSQGQQELSTRYHVNASLSLNLRDQNLVWIVLVSVSVLKTIYIKIFYFVTTDYDRQNLVI